MARGEGQPSHLGRYEIQRELGRGAMGVVYLARDPMIGRPVAVKTFASAGFDSESELERAHRRFVREAESAGSLLHPNIVTLYDIVDESPDGDTFIAMEYVEGSNLAVWMRRGVPITFEEIVQLLEQAAAGLDYAHRRGVVHRDIKPANLLLTSALVLKIADFGIAKLLGSNLTLEPEVMGTPNYMPPEIMEGRVPDIRSDIYALGVVAYELLTGSPPFAAPTIAGVVLKVVRGDLTPPDELTAGIPKGSGAVLARALDRDPNRRFPSAEEFVRELRTVLLGASHSGGSVVYRSLAPAGLTQIPTRLLPEFRMRFLRRRARPIALRLLGVLAMVLLLVGTGYLGLRLAARPTTSEPGEAARTQYLEALHSGLALIERGEPNAASAEFRRAQALQPTGTGADRLREKATQAAASRELARRREVILSALDEHRYVEALGGLGALLELGPSEQESRQLLAAVQEGLRQSSSRPGEAASETRQGAVAGPAMPWAAVAISFASPIADGVLVIYNGSEQVLRMPFGELRRLEAQKTPALVRAFAPEHAVFRVYTSVARRPARSTTVAADLKPGSTSRLRIVQATAESLIATLE